MRRTKYYSNYGYISGSGIFDLPDFITHIIKESAVDIGKKGIAAVGSKVGDKLADWIIKKKSKRKVAVKHESGESARDNNEKTEEDIRREVLEDLKIIPKSSKKRVVYGEGIRYL